MQVVYDQIVCINFQTGSLSSFSHAMKTTAVPASCTAANRFSLVIKSPLSFSQQGRHFGMPFLLGTVERLRPTRIRGRYWIGALFQQKAHHLHLALARGGGQRRPPVGQLDRVDIRT